MRQKLMYVVTCHSKHVQLGDESTFLTRITNSLEEGKKLLQSIYNDASKNYLSRYGLRYSNPVWMDDKHLKVQVTCDIVCGYIHSTTIETYQLTYDWNTNILDRHPWVL